MKKTNTLIMIGAMAVSLIGGAAFDVAQPTASVQAATSYKTIKGYTLSYNVPKNVEVTLFKDKVLFKRNGIYVGGIDFLTYDGKQTPASLLPTYATVIDSRNVTGTSFPCVRYFVQTEDSQDYHSLLLDKSKKRAFDFWANSRLLTDSEIKQIRASIKVLR